MLSPPPQPSVSSTPQKNPADVQFPKLTEDLRFDEEMPAEWWQRDVRFNPLRAAASDIIFRLMCVLLLEVFQY